MYSNYIGRGQHTTIRVHSHSYEYESGYLYTGSSKHEFACIWMVAVHIDTSPVRVRVTCEFHSYEQFLDRLFFLSNPYDVNNTKFVLI